MFIIGLTGGTGSGKTTALSVLESLGALALDCDAIYHDLLRNNTKLVSELEDRFPGVLKDGMIDRKYLAAIVFSEPSALLDLNKITHKYICEAVEHRLAQWDSLGGKVAVIDAIALIESGLSDLCDVVVGVTAQRVTRLSRIVIRDGITLEQAEMRINAQKPDSFFSENCDYLLENDYTEQKDFEERCVGFFNGLIGGFTNAD